MYRPLLVLTAGLALAFYQFRKPVCCLGVLAISGTAAVLVNASLATGDLTWKRWVGAMAWAQLGSVLGAAIVIAGPQLCEVPVLGALAGALLVLLGRLLLRVARAPSPKLLDDPEEAEEPI